MAATLVQRAAWLGKFLSPSPRLFQYHREVRRSGHFDRAFYLGVNASLHPLFRAFPERHFVVFGEREGLQPNPEFSSRAYLRQNTDLTAWAEQPYQHFLRHGRFENRPTRELPAGANTGKQVAPVVRARGDAANPFAIVVHVYYHDLWPEIAARLQALDFAFDLFVTVTDNGDQRSITPLIAQIEHAFPKAHVLLMPNRGRDIFPFVHLVNSGLLRPYKAVCKIHTKRSPHRIDGDTWRARLTDGILPTSGAAALLQTFLDNETAGILVADDQHYRDPRWWGTNFDITAWLLRRIEIRVNRTTLAFPAGSMYWLKPVIVSLIGGLQLEQSLFETECGQVDGTLAHAFERAVGYLATSSGLDVLEVSELARQKPTRTRRHRARYVSAFYLPQFHRTAENDAWWGHGYTEWQATAQAKPMFDGHAQPTLPSHLGFYDLKQTEVMAEQAALARDAGIDAFCVYHYWFDGRRILEAPLDRLLERPDVEFPFYLCWANESWRRNWDGLSGETLLHQGYGEGFETELAVSTLPYMRDPRYQRPDGVRPRFLIYRPEDMPDPARNVAKMRAAWRALGVGEVELGAVRFHVEGDHAVTAETFDFWVEMPPHGLVNAPDYLFGGPDGNRMGLGVTPDFQGLIYDYNRVIDTSLSPDHFRKLPPNTIAGAMPSWDNTARRGVCAHIAYGAHPGSFQRWLRGISQHRLETSYRGELFLNAWNEWAEKAVLEPSHQYDRAWLDVLKAWRNDGTTQQAI